MSLGFEQAGFDVLAAVEYDPVHAAVHEFNFPLTNTLCADVADLSGARLLEHLELDAGQLDVIFGGPPCQGFSLIGKRLADDKRNRLVFHFYRLVSELRPRYFVMENVPGMLTANGSGIVDRLLEEFAAIGYRVVQPVSILNAADYGVPQDRRRLFLIGARDGQELPAYPPALVVPAGAPRSDAEVLSPGPTVWDALRDLPDLDGFEALKQTDEVPLPNRLLQRMERNASPYARLLRGMDRDRGDFSYPRRWEASILTSSRRTMHTPNSVSRFEATRPGDTEPVSRFFRLPPEGLCNTIRAGTGSERGAFTSPRPIHPVLPRVISVREAARLHSFPDWFRLHKTKWHGFRQVGNSVPPLLARAVAAEVVRALGVRPKRPRKRLRQGNASLLDFSMRAAAEYFDADPASIPQPRRRGASSE